jgi:hypothetical protein
MIRRRFLFLWAVLAGIVLAGLAPPAQAAFRLRVEDTDANVGVVLTGGTVTSGSGSIVFNGMVGSYSIVVTTAVTSHPGAQNYGELDLNNIQISSSAGTHHLRITVEDTSYSAPAGNVGLVANIGGTLGAGTTINAQSWADGTNAAPNLGTDAGTTSNAVSLAGNGISGLPTANGVGAFMPPFSAGPGPTSFSGGAGANFATGGAFALYGQVLITTTMAQSTSSFDLDTFAVPVPASMILVFSAVPGLGIGCWLRRRKQQPAVA